MIEKETDAYGEIEFTNTTGKVAKVLNFSLVTILLYSTYLHNFEINNLFVLDLVCEDSSQNNGKTS